MTQLSFLSPNGLQASQFSPLLPKICPMGLFTGIFCKNDCVRWNKFRKAVSNMLTWLFANLVGLLRAFIMLK